MNQLNANGKENVNNLIDNVQKSVGDFSDMSKHKQAITVLNEVFGYDKFRLLQEEIILNILDRNDTLVIMPTGGGKSLCYQIPALLFDGLTVVVSPLISLMKDQVEQLAALNVPAVFLNSSLSAAEYNRNIQLVRNGWAKLLYVAPETLLTPRLQALLAKVKLDSLTIDEAHCISEWGHDFRPEYRRLVAVRKQFPKAVCVALTATATPQVQKDIRDNLGFRDDNQYLASFNRENLFIRIVPKVNPVEQTIDFLREFPEKSGIIYCHSRQQVEDLAEELDSREFSVRPYHAGMTDPDRKRNQELFIRDDVQIIVATIAFGMGINKPNVRFVLHFDLPNNIEGYYQQIGRAGRDGLRAECLLLFGYGDISKIRYFITKKEEAEQRIANMHLNALLRYAETDICRRNPLLNYFGEAYNKENCGMCDNCLVTDREYVDITIPAQMFLSCVKRTGERFGASHLIDVLRGSQSQKVINLRHNKLSTYGIGADYSRKQWMHMSRQFIQKDLLQQDPQYGSLLLTPKAYDVLKNREKVTGRIEKDVTQFRVVDTAPTNYDVELFQHLKKRRKYLADQEKVPPYVIFSDRTLIEMATYFPQSEISLLRIHGVGLAKMEKYGERFLSGICGYCHRKGIEDQVAKAGAGPQHSRHTASGLKRKYLRVGEAFNAGSSILDLENEMRVKAGTIIDNLMRYLLEGNTIKPERANELLEMSKLSQDDQKKVISVFDQLGTEFLKPAFEELEEMVSYDELRLLRLVMLIKTGSG